MTPDRQFLAIKDICDGSFIYGLTLSSENCWPIVGCLGTPLGNSSTRKLLVNGRCTDDSNLKFISAGR